MNQKVPFPWQEKQWKYLVDRAAAKTLPHAVLLAGPQGLGKLKFAVELSHLLLCQTEPRFEKICHHCTACHLLTANTHPDLVIMDETESGKIKVDAIREFLTWQHQSSHQGSYKIAIITPAHGMNKAAANALLKTLEEPTSSTLIILISDQLSLIPSTIRSRCQIINFSSAGYECAKIDMLRQMLSQSGDESLLLHLADGSPWNAIDLASGEKLQQRSQLLRDLLSPQKDPIALANQCNSIELEDVLLWMTGCVVDLIRMNFDVQLERLLNQDFTTEIKVLVTRVSPTKLYVLLDRLYQYRRQHKIGINYNRQLLVESLLCHWVGIFKE